jgi:hypothetical protein
MDMSEYIRNFRSEEGRKKIFAEEEKDEILDILSTLLALLALEEEEEDDLLKETEAMDAILLDVYLKGIKKGIQTSQKFLDYENEDDEGPARWRVLRNGVALPILFKNKELAKDYIYELIERQQGFNYYELALMDSLIFKN